MLITRILITASFGLISIAAGHARSGELTHHRISPLKPIPSEQWIERLSGDFEKPGLPFVIRIHLDAGLITLPHTHPEDENITVVQGKWWLGTGPKFVRSDLEPIELGAYGFVPKKMAHFAWSDRETVLQVHGIGPFRSDLIDPSYVLTANGVLLQTILMHVRRQLSWPVVLPHEQLLPSCLTRNVTRCRLVGRHGVADSDLARTEDQLLRELRPPLP